MIFRRTKLKNKTQLINTQVRLNDSKKQSSVLIRAPIRALINSTQVRLNDKLEPKILSPKSKKTFFLDFGLRILLEA